MARRTSVAICEASGLFRDGVASLLRDNGYRIHASVAQADALEPASSVRPGEFLVVLGESSRGEIDLGAVAKLRALYVDPVIVLMVSAYCDEQLFEAARRGINGILLKSISREALLRGIELIMLGQNVFSQRNISRTDLADTRRASFDAADGQTDSSGHPDGAALGGDAVRVVGWHAVRAAAGPDAEADWSASKLSKREDLSNREREILSCLVSGHSNKIIARSCSITEATVKVHLKAILRKIRVANRTQAAVWAMEKGIHEPQHLDEPRAGARFLDSFAADRQVVTNAAAPAL